MFGIFGSNDPAKKLKKLYKKLLQEAYELSHVDRKAADAKMAEAEKVIARLEDLRAG